MSTPTPQPTMKRARSLTMLLTVVGMVGVLIGFAAWAVSSPVSGSPDDDYHLGSIWCPRPISESGCTFEIKDGVISSVEVPEPITDAKECVAFKPEKDASCALDAADSELVPTERFDNGDYPWGFYQFHNLFVGEDVFRSVVAMRIANVLIGLGGLFLVGILAAPQIRHNLLIATFTAWVPMGVYFVASNNPSSWALSGCLIYASALFASTLATGRRRLSLLVMAALGAVLCITSRADSAFYIFVITLALWFLVSITRDRLPSLAFSVVAALTGLFILASTGQADRLTSDGGWPTYPNLETWRIFVLNLLSLPEHVASWWGLTWGPGWFDVPLLGWSTLTMVFVAGGVVFVSARKFHVRKVLATLIMLGALLGIPAVSLTLRQVQPVYFYQGRYMLPLVAVALLIWLTRRDGKVFFRATGQLVFFAGIVALANSMALRQIIRRYSIGLEDNTLIGFGSPDWWPWPASPTITWALGSLAMLIGISALAAVTVRISRGLPEVPEQPAPVVESPDFFDFEVPTTAAPTESATSPVESGSHPAESATSPASPSTT